MPRLLLLPALAVQLGARGARGWLLGLDVPPLPWWPADAGHGGTAKHGVQGTGAIPDEVDWRKHNAVTFVRSANPDCEDPYFAVAGAIEGAWAIKTGRLLTLSQQQFVDCTNGSKAVVDAFDLASTEGVCNEESYLYLGKKGDRCQDGSRCRVVVAPNATKATWLNFSGASWKHKVDKVQALVVKGPVVAGIFRGFGSFYGGGVYNGTGGDCPDGARFNSHILIVGYGTDKKGGGDYWLIKSNWGPHWGEGGFARISRNQTAGGGALCSIFDDLWFVTVADGKYVTSPYMPSVWASAVFSVLVAALCIVRVVFDKRHLADVEAAGQVLGGAQSGQAGGVAGSAAAAPGGAVTRGPGARLGGGGP